MIVLKSDKSKIELKPPSIIAGEGGSGEGAVKSVNGRVGNVVLTAEDIGAASIKYVDKSISEIELLKGDKGDKGDTGEPFTYDMFTPEQLASLKGEKGDIGAPGKDGINGTNGADGYTPVKGVDYLTDAEINEMVEKVLENLPNAMEVRY